MQATLGVVIGILLGFAAIKLLGNRIDPDSPPVKPSALAWTAFGSGLVALMMVAAGLAGPALARLGAFPVAFAAAMPAALSIVFAVGSLVAAMGALAKKDRHWVTWTALLAATLPVVFWIWFIVAELVSPNG